MSRKMSFGDQTTGDGNEANDEIVVLRKRLAEHELLHSKIKAEFDALKQVSEESNLKATKYYKLLEEERNERKRIEAEALEMLKHVKNKYEKSVINETINKLKSKYEKRIEVLKNEYHNKCTQIKNEYELNTQKANFHNKESFEAMKRDYEKTIEKISSECDKRLDEIRAECDLKTEEIKGEYEKVIETIQTEHEQTKSQVDSINTEYEKRFEQLKDEYEKQIRQLTKNSDKVDKKKKSKKEKKEEQYLKVNKEIKDENEWGWDQDKDVKVQNISDQFEISDSCNKSKGDKNDWDLGEGKGVSKQSVRALKLDYEKRIADKMSECDQRIDEMRIECDSKIEQMKSDYEQRIEQIEVELKEAKSQVDFVKNEAKFNDKENMESNENSEEIKKRVNELTAQYKEDAAMAKLDLRIAKRELERNQEQISFLREHSRELKKEMSELQELYDKEKAMNATKDEVIEGLKSQIKVLENDIKVEEKEHQLFKALLEEKIKSLENDSKAMRELQNDESKWRAKYDECYKRNEQLFQTMQQLEIKYKTLEVEFSSKNSECEQKEATIRKLANTNKILKEQCSVIEKQAEQYKNKYIGQAEQKEKLLVDKNDTKSEIQRLNKELENIRNKLESELRDKEEAYKRLESEQLEYEKQIQIEKQKLFNFKQEFEKECQKSRQYEERLSIQERDLNSSDETISNLEAKVSYLEENLVAIKEEAAKHITTIANLKDVNHNLTIALEESMEKVESLQDRIEKLHNQFDAKEEELNHERITTQETINQQLKLIDFLQDKVESLEKQKKPLFSITPTKKIVNNQRYCPMELKDFDKALAEEKLKSKRLAEELHKIMSEANYYKTEVLQLKKSIKTDDLNFDNEPFRKPLRLFDDHNNVVSEVPVQNQTPSQLDKSSKSFQRMHHNIPHRFTEVTNKSITKCVSCAEIIHFGRKIVKCNECSATSHPKCAGMLPNNCGLPVELMQHLFLSSNDVNDSYFDDIQNGEQEQDIVEVQELEPSAPEAHSPINYCDSSNSSATTDNNDSDKEAMVSQAFGTHTNSDIREVEAICANNGEGGFSFTDSMLEILESKQE